MSRSVDSILVDMVRQPSIGFRPRHSVNATESPKACFLTASPSFDLLRDPSKVENLQGQSNTENTTHGVLRLGTVCRMLGRSVQAADTFSIRGQLKYGMI
jgi:hypothetical protein